MTSNFEYCISAGEGTLIDYGVCDARAMNDIVDVDGPVFFMNNGDMATFIKGGQSMRFRLASPDCATGQ